MAKRIQNGIMTPNEAREKDDVGAYADGDRYYMASNIQPIGLPAPAQPGGQAEGK
jgi:hypothetical protein